MAIPPSGQVLTGARLVNGLFYRGIAYICQNVKGVPAE
jgi:hypothetical protein